GISPHVAVALNFLLPYLTIVTTMGNKLATTRGHGRSARRAGGQPAAVGNTVTTDGNELLLAALAGLGEGLSIFDADLRLVACNDRYLDLLALPKEFGRPG